MWILNSRVIQGSVVFSETPGGTAARAVTRSGKHSAICKEQSEETTITMGGKHQTFGANALTNRPIVPSDDENHCDRLQTGAILCYK